MSIELRCEINVEDLYYTYKDKSPRATFDQNDIVALAESIKKHGLKEPVVILVFQNTKESMLSGMLRVIAFRYLGIEKIPAIIKL